SAWAFFTYGSEKCSFSQRWLLLLRVAMAFLPPSACGTAGLPGEGRAVAAAAVATRAAPDGDCRRHDTLRGTSPIPRIPMSIALTAAQNRFLRGQAHDLKAMLQVGGKGVTDAVVAEIDGALEHHELIKVKVAADDRDARNRLVGELAQRSGAALVQRIGHVAVLYRPSKDKRQIVLPRA